MQDLCDETEAEDFSLLTVQVLSSVKVYIENRYDGNTRSQLHLCIILDPWYDASFLQHDDEKEQYEIKLVNQMAELRPTPHNNLKNYHIKTAP